MLFRSVEFLSVPATVDLSEIALELLSQVTDSLTHSNQLASDLGIYGSLDSFDYLTLETFFAKLLHRINHHLLSGASGDPPLFLVRLLSYLVTRLFGTAAGLMEDHPVESACVNVATFMTKIIVNSIYGKLKDGDSKSEFMRELIDIWHHTILALHLTRRKVLSPLRVQLIEAMCLAKTASRGA